MKRTLVLLSLVAGMGIQAVDWYALRGTQTGRQVESKATYGNRDGIWGYPKPQ